MNGGGGGIIPTWTQITLSLIHNGINPNSPSSLQRPAFLFSNSIRSPPFFTLPGTYLLKFGMSNPPGGGGGGAW